jgi:hypothetical protein
MFLRQPFVHRGRQQKSGLSINRAEVGHRQEALITRESTQQS